MTTTLVDPKVSRRKFRTELELWKAHSEHQSRGWLLLTEDETTPSVELAFLSRVAMSVGSGPLPIVVCAVRLNYDNYDLWPPSLTFIDVFTRTPSRPPVRAFVSTPEGPRDVLIDGHPSTKQPFLCLPGIREYHWHPQHSGDDWFLHRPMHEGSLSNICERIWRLMVRNVIGLNLSVQTLPAWPLKAQIAFQITQGEVAQADNIAAALKASQ